MFLRPAATGGHWSPSLLLLIVAIGLRLSHFSRCHFSTQPAAPYPPESSPAPAASSFQLLDQIRHFFLSISVSLTHHCCPGFGSYAYEELNDHYSGTSITDGKHGSSLCSALIGVSVNTGWIYTACSNVMRLLSPIHEI